jgi:hypothetical protein
MPIKTTGVAYVATCGACGVHVFVGWQPGERLPVASGTGAPIHATPKNEFDVAGGPITCPAPCGVTRLEWQHGRALLSWPAGKPEPTLSATNIH